MSYGPFGGLKRSVDAKSREMTYMLDGLNRTTLIHHPGNFNESFSYDGAGNVLSHTDLRGAVSQMTYDNLSRPLTTVVQDTQGAIPVRTMAYDDAASTETSTDANNHPTVMEYDGLPSLTRVTNAASQFRTLTYDGMNLVRRPTTNTPSLPTSTTRSIASRRLPIAFTRSPTSPTATAAGTPGPSPTGAGT